MSYSTQERVEIVLLMAKFNSYTTVRRELQKQKWSQIPTEKTVKTIFSKFKETGFILDVPKAGRPSLDEEKTKEIIKFFKENPATSVRAGAIELDCSHTTVYKAIRHDEGLYPYKIQLTQ